jgi:pimeloyl-ACP methyl ester carboxylesterase
MVAEITRFDLDGRIFDISTNHRAGETDLVVFFHGLACSKENFEDIFGETAYANASLLSFDLPGFGDSPIPEGFGCTMEEYAAICDGVIRHFGDSGVHVVAHSMGAAVALLLSEEILGELRSFANVEGNLVGSDCFVSRRIKKATYRKFQSELLPNLKNYLTRSPDQLRDLNRTCETAYYKSAASLVDWSDGPLLMERFGALTCPRAYFYGERNAGIPVLSMLSRVEKIMIKNAGHFMMTENPTDFYRKLYQFQFSSA